MSKQNKHTPWAYYPTGKIMQGYSQPFVIAEAGKTNLIAGIFGDTVGGLETAEANARLIAAAPGLLAALKELLASEMSIMPPFEAGKDAQDAWADRMAKARNDAAAVINRTEGRSDDRNRANAHFHTESLCL